VRSKSELKCETVLTVVQAGRRGGQATLERRGVEFFREIGRRGGQRTKELYGDLLSRFGKRGGRPRRPDLTDMREELPESKGG
jgi:hypothetical protein